MAFVEPSRLIKPIAVGTSSIGKSGGYSSGSGFVSGLNSILKPGVNFNTQLNLQFGGNGNSSNGNSNVPPSKGGDSNPKSSKGGRPHKKFSGYYPSSELKTSSMSFNSGIRSGTIINPFEPSSPTTGSDLFLLAGSFLRNGSSSYYTSFLAQDIHFKVLTTVQNTVNYKAAREFTSSRFCEYINRLTDALQLYYCIDSILAYESLPSNTNRGMVHLRSFITADVLSSHERLKRTLITLPVPPNLLAFISYMMQIFKFDNTDYSPLYKLEFRSIFHSSSTKSISSDYYDIIIGELTKDSEIVSLLLRSFPSMHITNLLASSASPIFDKNFMSFWYNSCVTYYDGVDEEVKYTKACESIDTKIYYGHFCENDIDGLFYACSSVYNSGKSKIDPGLWTPTYDVDALDLSDVRQGCNLMCYDSTSNRFTAPLTNRVASQSAIHSAVFFHEDKAKRFIKDEYMNPSSQRVQTHSLDNLSQAVSQSVLFLFSGI